MYSTQSEKQEGKECHERLVVMLEQAFPEMSNSERMHVQNRVSNILRKCGVDIIQVWVSNAPINNAQYVSNYTFMQGEIKVYIQIQVD